MWSTLTGESNMYRQFKVWSIGKCPKIFKKNTSLGVLGSRAKVPRPSFGTEL